MNDKDRDQLLTSMSDKVDTIHDRFIVVEKDSHHPSECPEMIEHKAAHDKRADLMLVLLFGSIGAAGTIFAILRGFAAFAKP